MLKNRGKNADIIKILEYLFKKVNFIIMCFVFQTQEREAANRMREKAKELQRERLEAAKRGGVPRSHISFGKTTVLLFICNTKYMKSNIT